MPRDHMLPCLVVLAFGLWFLASIEPCQGFLVFLGNTTACDTCDEYQTYSGRNVLCCLAQSKCCGPTNFDELKSTVKP